MPGWTSRAARRCAALLLVLVTTAACGGGDPGRGLTRFSDVGELIAAVSAQQRIDRTARFSLRGELVGAEGARIRFTGVGELVIGDPDVELRFTQVVTQPGMAPQETGFVVLPDAVYLRVPADGSDDRPWVRVDPDDAGEGSAQLIAQADSLVERADLTGTMSRYAAATTITAAEDDVIEGDPAVRYTIVTDLARAAETATDPAVREQLEQQVRGGLTEISSTLWVDSSHRPLRSAARQQLPGIGTLAITSSYRDWGRTTEIVPPPDELVR